MLLSLFLIATTTAFLAVPSKFIFLLSRISLLLIIKSLYSILQVGPKFYSVQGRPKLKFQAINNVIFLMEIEYFAD